MLLAIDTATRYASIALYDASGTTAERTWRTERNHTCQVVPAIADVLAQQGLTPEDLTAVAVTKGPGSFTGLRIGMSVAKGLCLALGIPIIAVPTLDVMAYAVGDPGMPVLAVLEAGRGRLCVATFRFAEGLPVQEGEIALVSAADWVISTGSPVLVAGEISAELSARLLAQPDAGNIALSSLAGSIRRAAYLAELAWEQLLAGQVDDLDTLGPTYVRYPGSGSPGQSVAEAR